MNQATNFNKKNRKLNLYWSKCANNQNLGDICGTYILEQYGYDVEWKSWNEADTVAVGSIAHMAQPGSRVLGAGISSRTAQVKSDVNWVWVRGPYTRQRIIELGGTCPEIYGDIALLLPRLISSEEKIYKTAILSHYIDYKLLRERYPDALVINMQTNNMIETIKKITQCEKVISSSLHGIIIANAYGIPAAWASFNKLTGDNIKFSDYGKSVNVELEESTVENPKFICPHINTDQIHQILVNGNF
jgi:pyruvyltransferase